MARVELVKVARRFGRTAAIEDISFKVPDGQFWVLVGPSGCGKSTILRAIAGLDPVSEGTVYIGDRSVNRVPARQRDVAMVFQNYALYPHMSVAENLSFGLRMRRVAEPAEIARRVDAVARSLDIAHLLERKPRQLSGGQQQRVALGRAIVRQPQVFLLDEPLSNLDAQLRDETRTELKRLHARIGITTLYVTHDQIEAMTLADSIVVLDRGRIQQIGTPQAVYDRPANRAIATFLGSPPMNLLPATYGDGRFRIGDQTLAAGTLAREIELRTGKSYDLGIRPECLSLFPPEGGEFAVLQAVADAVEPLGRETLVNATLPGTDCTLNCFIPGLWMGDRGTRLVLHLPLNRAYLFDAATSERLYPRGEIVH
ncbi:ABC-type sugar transport system, ATPase component [Rubidibacter lacunae KORDI 51-2]|uniref:ABC-type sugar transport system, ATPase component n=1 Tax=Rubidibacter lacunae KORDI 51-2 TaxID=582515 RepID=U5DRA3_9CHRO|nr:ABC transporter ATP-binding protein [Rubidibacter lacunae]ERN43134.1 ABC-type sugar transport system, ATPase component [Rubidibacter lacunae KORDI 51-2]